MGMPNIMSYIPGFWTIMFIVLSILFIVVGGPYILAWVLEMMIQK